MNEQKENEICSICPSFFSDAIACINHEKNEMDTCMAFGLECGDGWFEPLKTMSEKICIINEIAKHSNYFYVCDQLKEKWGELTVYYSKRKINIKKELKENDVLDKMMRDTIQSATNECWNTCEYCGEEEDKLFGGNIVTTSGWIKRICKKCFFESKHDKIVRFDSGYAFINPFENKKFYFNNKPYYNIWCAYYDNIINDEIMHDFCSSKVESGIICSIATKFFYTFENDVDLMKKIVGEKLKRNYDLIHLKNKEIIFENRFHDNFWGNCTCDKCKEIEGLNHYGKIIMNLANKE